MKPVISNSLFKIYKTLKGYWYACVMLQKICAVWELSGFGSVSRASPRQDPGSIISSEFFCLVGNYKTLHGISKVDTAGEKYFLISVYIVFYSKLAFVHLKSYVNTFMLNTF